MKIPAFVLRQLYVKGSLRAGGEVRFTLHNSLAAATLTALKEVKVGGQAVPLDRVSMELDGATHDHTTSPDKPVVFPRGAEAHVCVAQAAQPGELKVRLVTESAEFGELVIEFEDDATG
ncbi:MAG: hypothetical protein LC624_10775 [Halobacteriales archaeon]|nr:hypothetical protein [Halobacteriales archaeon]